MGSFKIEITAVGGHGVDRDVKDGEVVNFFKEGNFTPDALAKTFERLVAHYGNQIESATMTHWPGDPNEVVDNLVTGVRKGNF